VNDDWNWTFFVKGDCDRPIDFIEKMQILLHSTYEPSKITLKAAPWELKRTGWGTFDIKVKIWLKSNSKSDDMEEDNVVEFIHTLSFDSPETKKKIELSL